MPPEVRAEYVEETKAADGEVSTSGLLRHAEGARAVDDIDSTQLAGSNHPRTGSTS